MKNQPNSELETVVFLERLKCQVRAGWKWSSGIIGAQPETEPQQTAVEISAMDPTATDQNKNPFE